MSDKLVSVVLPVYNGEEYLEAAINSILEQTYKNLELVIVDDASNDASARIIAAAKERDNARVSVFTNDKNTGLTDTLNKAFSLANGEYLCWMGQDDLMMADGIAKMAKFLNANPEVDLVYTDYAFADRNDELISMYSVHPPHRLLSDNVAGGSGNALFTRKLYDDLGGFTKEFYLLEDWDFLLKAYRMFKIAPLHEYTFVKRYHANSLSVKNKTKQSELATKLLVSHIPYFLSDWLARVYERRYDTVILLTNEAAKSFLVDLLLNALPEIKLAAVCTNPEDSEDIKRIGANKNSLALITDCNWDASVRGVLADDRIEDTYPLADSVFNGDDIYRLKLNIKDVAPSAEEELPENIYYDGFKPLFEKAAALNSEELQDSIMSMLKKLTPDKRNSELLRQIIECFERLRDEAPNGAIALFCLSYLIELTGEEKYFESFVKVVASGKVAGSSKHYLYCYLKRLADKFPYFINRETNAAMDALFEDVYGVYKRFLRADTELLPEKTIPKTAVLIADDIGGYPFGAVKHIADLSDFLSRGGYKITVVRTNERNLDYGKVWLCNTGREDDEKDDIECLTAVEGVKIHEFGTTMPYAGSVRAALKEIFGNGQPAVLVNFAGKNCFARLLSERYRVADMNEASPTERADTQKAALALIADAEKFVNAVNYEKAVTPLEKAYMILKNHHSKAKVAEQLARVYSKLARNEDAMKAVKSLRYLDDGAGYLDVRALAEEEAGNVKNAIYLREALEALAPDEYNNNIKLLLFYIEEKMFEKATEKTAYFLRDGQEPSYETYAMIYRYYHMTFDEEKASYYLDGAVRLSREAGRVDWLVNSLLLGMSGSLYNCAVSEETIISYINEYRQNTTPEKEYRWEGYKPKKEKIRLGFMAGGVARHPVGFFISSLFKEKCGGGRFEYYFYYMEKKRSEDDITQMIKDNAHVWRWQGDMSDELILTEILQDEIDIMIDLNGLSDTQKTGMLACRTAPLQMTWIGFPTSVPLKNMDYNIADRITDPPGLAEKYYTEKLMYLPKSFLCYGRTNSVPVKPPPFIENGYITFGSFNNGLKYSETILAVWARIFDEIKDARLLIRTSDAKNGFLKAKLEEKLRNAGLPEERFRILPSTHVSAYYDEYNNVDIILDTYPFNGATTTCDAFLMSTPIVSLYGNMHVTRVGLSMLTNIGHGELAVATADDYVKTAVELAHDKERLLELNGTLRDKALASPLFEHKSFKRDFEEAVYETYQNHKYL